MCGLIGFVSSNPKAVDQEKFYKDLAVLFERMQDKGGSTNNTDGCGWYHPAMGVVKGNMTAKEAIKGDLFKQMAELPVPSVFIGHTRKTTKGDSEHNENNHPLWSDNWIIAHNGSVESDDVKAEDYKLPGKVDSNLILAAIEKYGIEKWTDHLKGVAAILIAKRNDPNNLWVYRDTRPMFLYKAEYGIWISSTLESLEEIAETEGEDVDINELFPGFYPIHGLREHHLYNLHINQQRHTWKSTFLLKKNLPDVSVPVSKWSNVGTGTLPLYTKLGAGASPVEIATAFETKKYNSNYFSVCPNCADKLKLDHQKGSTTSISCSYCGSKANVRAIQNSGLYIPNYPMKYHISTGSAIPAGILNEFLTRDEVVAIQYEENINILKINKVLFVFFTNLHMENDKLTITLSENSIRATAFSTFKFPNGNKYVTNKADYLKISNGRLNVGLIPKNQADYGTLVKTVCEEYDKAFMK